MTGKQEAGIEIHKKEEREKKKVTLVCHKGTIGDYVLRRKLTILDN